MKYSVLVLLAMCLSSCDPVTFGSYKLSNSTKEPLTFFFYSSVDSENDTVTVSSYSRVDWREVSVSGSGSKKIDLEAYYDSVKIESKGTIVLNYRPKMSGKSIYNYDYWLKHKKGKRDYEYVFEISQEDISQD